MARTDICEMSDITSFTGVLFQGQEPTWRFFRCDEKSNCGQDISLGMPIEILQPPQIEICEVP